MKIFKGFIIYINMITAIILNMVGSKEEVRINDQTILRNQIKKKLQNKCAGNAQELGSWPYNNNKVTIYGWEEGNAGQENNHEIPPPHDTNLYFGDLLVVNSKGNNLINFTKKDYNKFFEDMYGGFEDIGDTDSEYSDD